MTQEKNDSSTTTIIDEHIPGCGNYTHLWDDEACLGTVDGSACDDWNMHPNSSISKEISKDE